MPEPRPADPTDAPAAELLPVFEAVPNFSEGRDLPRLRDLVGVLADTGAEVLDWSADPDHHRTVVTLLGDAPTLERAALAGAAFARDHFDLTRHTGVHPRVGALDVLPFVPLQGGDLDDAAALARRVGRRLAEEVGLPVYLYGHASPERPALADLRRGGFEALVRGFPAERAPDFAPAGTRTAPHPTAGTTCVGARPVLLAWNVYVEGVPLDGLRRIAGDLRERGGGFRGLRTLALELPTSGRTQISMNLEDLRATSPFDVYEAIERAVSEAGGRTAGTEIIGMMPDPLVLPAAADRLGLLDPSPSRLLSARLAEHVSRRARGALRTLVDAVARAGEACPPEVRAAATRASAAISIPTESPGPER